MIGPVIGPGLLEYRCRRCSTVERSMHTPNLLLSLTEITATGRARSSAGTPAHLVDLHHCADGGVGVTDLIGGVFDPKEAP